MTTDKVVSLRGATIEKNRVEISEAANVAIDACLTLLRLSGVKSGSIMAIDADTEVVTHIITIKSIEDKE